MTLKKILSLILVICMLGAMLSLTACREDDDDNNDGQNDGYADPSEGENRYTVKIVDQDDNPVVGAQVTFTDGKQYFLGTTDDAGKAISLNMTGNVSAMVIKVPDGYEKPAFISGTSFHAVFSEDVKEITVVANKKADNKVTYSVRVLDQNDKPVEGIEVQLCYNGICAAAVPTDDEGFIYMDLDEGTVVDVKLYEIDGYTLPEALDSGYHAVISEGSTKVTVVITQN